MAEYNPSKIIKDGNTYNFRDTTKIPLAGSNQISGDLIPATTNVINLGSSTNKWKSFNGINPGALSLPGDTYITIDTTNFAWGANFTFTPSVNGYLFINLGSSNGVRRLSLKTSRGEYYITNQIGIIRFTVPVYENNLVAISVASSITETVVPTITLFPLQGNV